jgi:hypothetical protein
LRDESLRATIGADQNVSSLRDGVVRSLQVATGEVTTAQAPADNGVVMLPTTPRSGNGNGNIVKRIRRPA